ncbi:MAG: NAD(P)H-quinone oxidoreductase [Armatimonadota bacterium]
MRAVQVTHPGGPEVLIVGDEPTPVPTGNEVLIEVYAAGVNRPDLAQREGKYPPPPGASPLMGLEVAGVVVARGEQATLAMGEAVCALVPGGGYAEYCLAPESHCLPIPKGWSFESAAGIPETFFTVWANVFQLGGLRRGERLLGHGGASGIGTTAIQLASALGAEVIATAGTDEKCAACISLGAKHAINYRTADFAEAVPRLTDGRGVDVILDMVGGSYTAKNLDCLAPGGRLVQIATLEGAKVDIDLRKIMQKRLTVTGSTMRPRTIEDKAIIARELRETVWPLLDTRQVDVIIDRVFDLNDVRLAHEHLERGEHIGKVILKVK